MRKQSKLKRVERKQKSKDTGKLDSTSRCEGSFVGVKGVKRSPTFGTEDLGSNQRPAAHSMGPWERDASWLWACSSEPA